MITNIHIENFKSIQSLDLELGRLNIFIGANGSDKSNILEAIAMGSAAMEDKLDDEFLIHRGVRITENKLMKSGFKKSNQKEPIHIVWSNDIVSWGLNITSDKGHFDKWVVDGGIEKEIEKQTKKVNKQISKQLKSGKWIKEI